MRKIVIFAMILYLQVNFSVLAVNHNHQNNNQGRKELYDKPPRSKTNINKVTDLFEKNIENKKELDDFLKEQNESAQKNIENLQEEVKKSIVGDQDITKEVEKLKSIDENSLDSKGRAKFQEEDYKFINQGGLFPNYDAEGNKAHIEDIDKIVNATETKLKDLIGQLNKEGFDCKDVKGATQTEQSEFIHVEKTEHKNLEFDQMFCEQLRNKYDCYKSRIVKCAHKASESFLESSFNSNLPVSYDDNTGILTFGWNQNHTKHGGSGTLYDFEISFNIDNIEAVTDFKLMEIGWDDHIRITINDQQIFMGPLNGDRLELTGYKGIFGEYRTFVTIDESGKHYSPEYDKWWQRQLNIDLRKYLKLGKNIIKTRLIVGGSGGIWLKFISKRAICSKWEDRWEEICSLSG